MLSLNILIPMDAVAEYINTMDAVAEYINTMDAVAEYINTNGCCR